MVKLQTNFSGKINQSGQHSTLLTSYPLMYVLLEIHVTIIVDKHSKINIPSQQYYRAISCVTNVMFILPPYLFKELFTGNALEISLRPEWQIDNSFFKSYSHLFKDTQVLVHSSGPRIRVWCCFTDGLVLK